MAFLQVYDKDGRHVPASSTATLPKEVTELQKIFPSADIEALMNALFVSDNSVDAAKAVSPSCSVIVLRLFETKACLAEHNSLGACCL